MDDYNFLDQIAKEHRAMREDLPEVTPEEAEWLRRTYPKDTPAAYKAIPFDEFFDGAF